MCRIERVRSVESLELTAKAGTAVSDAPWSSPRPGAALAALDRFHPIPDVPARAESWADWLYFNGQAGDKPLLPDVSCWTKASRWKAHRRPV